VCVVSPKLEDAASCGGETTDRVAARGPGAPVAAVGSKGGAATWVGAAGTAIVPVIGSAATTVFTVTLPDGGADRPEEKRSSKERSAAVVAADESD